MNTSRKNWAHFKVWRKRLLKLANVYLMQRAIMNAVDILLDFMEFQLPKLHHILTIGTLASYPGLISANTHVFAESLGTRL